MINRTLIVLIILGLGIGSGLRANRRPVDVPKPEPVQTPEQKPDLSRSVQPAVEDRAITNAPTEKRETWNENIGILTAHCYNKTIAPQYTEGYNPGNNTFERITDGQDMCKLWETIDWKASKVVFPELRETRLGKVRPQTLPIFLRTVWKDILQNQENGQYGQTQVLFKVMCQQGNISSTSQTSNQEQGRMVYFCLETRSPESIRGQSGRAQIGDGTTLGQILNGDRGCAPLELYAGRQSPRESVSVPKQGQTSKSSRKMPMAYERIYKDEGTSKGTDGLCKSETWNISGYCSGPCCCKPFSDGQTANGHRIKPGDRFIAAPKSIPFGTWITVPGYGRAQVLDRGGAIKGQRLDLYFPTHKAALQWGRQHLNIKIER